VAQELQTTFSGVSGSHLARVGGDEFSVLVSGQPASEVIRMVNGLCAHTWKFVTGRASPPVPPAWYSPTSPPHPGNAVLRGRPGAVHRQETPPDNHGDLRRVRPRHTPAASSG
jgi:hypothetical protein